MTLKCEECDGTSPMGRCQHCDKILCHDCYVNGIHQDIVMRSLGRKRK